MPARNCSRSSCSRRCVPARCTEGYRTGSSRAHRAATVARNVDRSIPLAARGDGRHELRFTDGATVVTTVLVGADGAWSRIRPLLSDATPSYTGYTSVETFLFDGDTRHRATAEAVGAGSLFALAPGKGFLAHRERGGTLHAYVQLEKPQDWFAGTDVTDGARRCRRGSRPSSTAGRPSSPR